ncbi:MAG: nucleotide pyrophosphatase/phosphodiesterase family protein [Acidimicrobiia bacterium]
MTQPTPPVVVLCVVGMSPRLLAHMPALSSLAAAGFSAPLGTVLPAVTCAAQATLLTGEMPSVHGIVGNGWFFRDLGEVWLWRQGHGLIEAETVWDTARRSRPDLTVANICWWYAMGSTADVTVTPRPVYHADGRKSPDCYTRPSELHDELDDRCGGRFPLFQFWGPGAGIASSEWISRAAEHVMARHRPDLTFVYLPHLDYDLQRHGPSGEHAVAAARAVDAVARRVVDAARARGAVVVALSEYGITPATRPVGINRALRRAGLVEVHTQAGMEYLDPYTSGAFAVADHQVAHVYVRDQSRMAAVADLLAGLDGVDEVLDDKGKAAAGLDHPRAGDLVAVAEPGAWFTYYYWLDDDRAPDFARTVEIHRKPGYDPAELFMDPADRLVKAKAGVALAKKKVGLRYTLPVVPLDPSCVRGTHGRPVDDPADGPVLVASDARLAPDGDGPVAPTAVKPLLLAALSSPE